MAIENIEDLRSPPVVGRMYLVPCVLVGSPKSRKVLGSNTPPRGCGGMLPGWWPVIGPHHEDAELLNFPFQHWHYDLRFLSNAQVENRGKDGFHTTSSVLSVLPRPLTNHGELESPVLRPRRCMREQVDWSNHPDIKRYTTRPEALRKMERITAQKHHGLKSCMRCPHRGLPLGSMPVIDGVITCPGHGIRFHASTGKVVQSPGSIRSPSLKTYGRLSPIHDPRCARFDEERRISKNIVVLSREVPFE